MTEATEAGPRRVATLGSGRPDVDLLLLSLGTTRGLRLADRAFVALATEAGAHVAAVGVRIGWTGRLRRAYPVTDGVEALAARRALRAALDRHRPRAVVLSTTTAAMLAPALPVPNAVRLDAPAVLNRPGRRNAVLHNLERRRLRAARLILPTSHAAAEELPSGSAPAVVVPPPLVPSGPPTPEPEDLAVAYTPDPKAKGLDLLCAAWASARPAGARLAVFGIERARALAFLARHGMAEPPGIDWRGMAGPDEFRATLRRARALVVSARWEDFGMTELEALADGALLVTGPAGGAYEALRLARALDPALVADSVEAEALAGAIRAAFAMDAERLRAYRAAAAGMLSAFSPEAVATTIAARVLPALLDGRP